MFRVGQKKKIRQPRAPSVYGMIHDGFGLKGKLKVHQNEKQEEFALIDLYVQLYN